VVVVVVVVVLVVVVVVVVVVALVVVVAGWDDAGLTEKGQHQSRQSSTKNPCKPAHRG
jgi:flagellar basal body-associated protein FliL